MSSQANQHDQAGAQQTLENLALNYNRASDWSQLIDVALGGKNVKDADALYLLRLKYMIPDAMRDFDYTSLASAADQQTYSTEAYNVLQKGISSGKITQAKAGALYTHARAQAALDQKELPEAAAAAAKSKTGYQDIKLADDYWGYGRYADAEAAARQAISKGGLKDPNQAQLLLGTLLVAQGKYDDAITALGQVSGTHTNTAHLWSVYAQAQKKSQGSTAAH